MHTSFAAIFLAVLAPMAALASPQWHPYGPPHPPPDMNHWHSGPPGPEPSATVSIAAGILPSGVSGVSGAGSTGTATPKKEKKKEGVSASAPAASASVSVISYG